MNDIISGTDTLEWGNLVRLGKPSFRKGGSTIKEKNFAPKGSKFFPFIVDSDLRSYPLCRKQTGSL